MAREIEAQTHTHIYQHHINSTLTHLRECDRSLGGLRVRGRLRRRLREPEVGGCRATQRVEVGLGRAQLRAQISDDRLLRDALLSRLVQLLLRVGQTRARLQSGLRWMAVGNKESTLHNQLVDKKHYRFLKNRKVSLIMILCSRSFDED